MTPAIPAAFTCHSLVRNPCNSSNRPPAACWQVVFFRYLYQLYHTDFLLSYFVKVFAPLPIMPPTPPPTNAAPILFKLESPYFVLLLSLIFDGIGSSMVFILSLLQWPLISSTTRCVYERFSNRFILNNIYLQIICSFCNQLYMDNVILFYY